MMFAPRLPVLVPVCLLVLAWLPAASAAPPFNDDIATPRPLPGDSGVSLSLDPSEATAASDDPGCGTPVFQSLWFSFVSPVDQFVQFSVLDSLGVRPRLSVWTGEPGALSVVDCHPDAHEVGLQAVAGTEYLVMLSSPEDGALARAVLTSNPNNFVNPNDPVPPANNLFWYAQPITALPFATTVDVGAGRGDVGFDPPTCNNPLATSVLGDTLWYTLEVDDTQEVDALFTSDFSSPYVGVFTGDLDDPALVACSYLGESRRGATRFVAEPGKVYHIEFASGTEAVGSRFADLAVRPAPAPLGGSIEVTPRVGTYLTWDWFDPIFKPNRHLVVRGFVFCDAPLAQVTVELLVAQGISVASESGTAACLGGMGSYTLEMDYVNLNFHLGPALVTARAWDFDSHFDTPQITVPVWIGRGQN